MITVFFETLNSLITLGILIVAILSLKKDQKNKPAMS